MTEITIRQARAVLSRLDEELAKEGEIIITRRGRPLAKLVPMYRSKAVPSHRELRDRMPRLRRGSEKLVREDRDER
jgi:prevent-host-death family protein